jgi:hypothetical protein
MRRPLGQAVWAETPVAARAAMKTEVKLTILMDWVGALEAGFGFLEVVELVVDEMRAG